jgi:lipoprotein-anchoring transpeptidase ErfK/SrfK
VTTTRRQVLAASVVPAAALASLLAGAPAAQASPVPTTAVLSAAAAAAATAPASISSISAVASSSATMRIGSKGKAVLAAQKRLAGLGYWLGTPDGVYGPATAHAVTALQKVAGLSRDGVLGPKTAKALAAGTKPTARSERGDGIEVDLARQVLLVVHHGHVRTIFDASTGSGEYYTSGGRRKHAVTPRGTFKVFRGVNGWDPGPLGRLYRPRYFNGGVAVHGYPSVPPNPASHGCVRVTLGAMDYLWSNKLLPIGRTVIVR